MTDVLLRPPTLFAMTLIDEGNRDALAIEVGARVIRVLDEFVAVHGRPASARVDNGPELLAQVVVDWCAERNIAVR